MKNLGHNRLQELREQIQTSDQSVRRSTKEALIAAMAAGSALNEAKDLLGHGKFMGWLADNVSVAPRTARLYMDLAKRRAAIEAKLATVANLTLREAAQIVTRERERRRWLAEMRTHWKAGTRRVQDEFLLEVIVPDLIQYCRERGDSERVSLYEGMIEAGQVSDWVHERFEGFLNSYDLAA